MDVTGLKLGICYVIKLYQQKLYGEDIHYAIVSPSHCWRYSRIKSSYTSARDIYHKHMQTLHLTRVVLTINS